MGELNAERARELLRYDPKTGRLFWQKSVRRGQIPAGTEAGCAFGHSYRRVKIDGRLYYAHILAWLIITGAWPAEEIDHINGDGFDNRWHNLREATHIINGRNQKRFSTNTSGVSGIGWHKRDRKWRAEIRVDGTKIHLGYFDTLNAAIAARKAAECQYGFHENHGRAA